MPLYISMSINDDVFDELKITRNKRLKDKDAVYPYTVQSLDGRTAHFEHRYSDGGLVCAERALTALRTMEPLQEGR